MLLITDGLPRGLGELTIDNRPVGARLLEMPTYTCTHCSAVVVMNPERKRERYHCRGCNHHICDGCAADRAAGAPCKTMAQKWDEHLQSLESSRPDGLNPPLKGN
jgi:DNA-directed RNA polymerase subunit RPC12/RpoP